MIQKRISIQEPCHENWESMEKKASGKFCNSCRKDVIDFRSFTQSELQDFFKDYQGNICGRFLGHQLEMPITIEIPAERFFTKRRSFSEVILLCFFVCFFSTLIHATPINNGLTKPEIVFVLTDSVQTDTTARPTENWTGMVILRDTTPAKPTDPVYTTVDEMPEFPGGTVAMIDFINSHIQYPAVAKEKGIRGKVFISFVIEATGKIGQIEVVRGFEKSLDEEAVRVVKAMPLWKPGKLRGKPVNVKYNIPIKFVL